MRTKANHVDHTACADRTHLRLMSRFLVSTCNLKPFGLITVGDTVHPIKMEVHNLLFVDEHGLFAGPCHPRNHQDVGAGATEMDFWTSGLHLVVQFAPRLLHILGRSKNPRGARERTRTKKRRNQYKQHEVHMRQTCFGTFGALVTD